MNDVPSLQELKNFRVNREGQFEAYRQSLYDFQSYDGTNGQTSLTFFQVPIGQNSKTIADTNMEIAGSLPQPKFFLVESIEVHFFPGVNPVNLTTDDAGTTAVASNFANDVYTVAKSGSLDLFIGSKSYLKEAPIGRLPPKTSLKTDFGSSISYTTATAESIRELTMDYAAAAGRPYFLHPKILLVPNQNFQVQLSWPSAVPLPSTQNARIGIVLDGVLYRESQ